MPRTAYAPLVRLLGGPTPPGPISSAQTPAGPGSTLPVRAPIAASGCDFRGLDPHSRARAPEYPPRAGYPAQARRSTSTGRRSVTGAAGRSYAAHRFAGGPQKVLTAAPKAVLVGLCPQGASGCPYTPVSTGEVHSSRTKPTAA